MHMSSRMLFTASAAPSASDAPVRPQASFIESERSSRMTTHPGSDRDTDCRYFSTSHPLVVGRHVIR